MSTGGSFPWGKVASVKVPTDLHLVPKLRMNGAVHPLCPFACMACMRMGLLLLLLSETGQGLFKFSELPVQWLSIVQVAVGDE